MKFSGLKLLIAAGMLALSAGAASAASVSFNLGTGPGSDVTSNSGTAVRAISDGLRVHITGRVFRHGIGSTSATSDATAWSNGIGLLRNQWHHDSHLVDGHYDEYLMLNFSEEVRLTSLTFSYADHRDDWRVYSGSFADFTFEDSGQLSNAGFVQTALVDSLALGTHFLVGTRNSHSGWKLQGLTVDLAPVPLPATGLLLLAGLGGLAVMRKRRAAAAAVAA
ncbi:VPLPA-CTERM sorting domain-containing protein [Roseicyclus sp.]|uniref:VPLPA-CTERM sorting domain-containing protein n=1 Tax=Roseicyclus sp. TaxID=1914329 RepID=UPI003FA032FC